MLDRLVQVALVAFVGFLAGCSPSVVASLVPVTSGPLVTVTTRGGECPEGMCESMIVIGRDGRVQRLAPAIEDLGIVPANALVGLDTAVRTTNFDAIRARRFTGECPMAYDGQEIVYEFGAPGGVQRIASCETEIHPDAPIFAAVSAAMQAASIRSIDGSIGVADDVYVIRRL
jgi:hypothetical protein